MQALDAPDAKLRIDHTGFVCPHATGSDRVIDRFGFAADEFGKVAVRRGERSRKDLGASPWVECGLRQDFARHARGFAHAPQVEAIGVAQVVGLNQWMCGGIGTAQPDTPAAVRMQYAGVQGVAVAWQASPAMVVEQRGNKVKLQVAARIGGVMRAHEATALGGIGGSNSLTGEPEPQTGQDDIDVVVGYGLGGGVQGADVEVILQVLAHGG